MDIIKRLFCFNDDDKSAIGLCKFNEDFFKEAQNKENFKKNLNKNSSLSEILKKPI